jgi:glyoxylase-like metal-dependent hydrolase (beta-lactamase superfamily II)
MSNAERVAPEIWRITTPVGARPREVHAYLVRLADDGYLLADGGLDTDAAWQALDAGVRSAAGTWRAVRVHVVTHMHMDHIGLAGRVRAASGAPLVMGRLDAERARGALERPDEEAEYRAALCVGAGAPAELLQVLQAARRRDTGLSGFVEPAATIGEDGGAVPGADGWAAVWTPGHTAGHISLFRAADRMLIAGDAVLPKITPTIGVNRQRADPVADYLDALRRLERLAPAQALPGHGDPISAPAARIGELIAETRAESSRVLAALGSAPASAWAVVERRYAGRSLPPAAQLQALRETIAHLDHLVARGLAAAEAAGPGEMKRFRPAGAA